MRLFPRLLVDWLLPVVAVLVVAIPNLGHAPTYDEVLHYDAAIGILEHGEPSIAQGRYKRGALYSYLVAGSFSVFGVSDVAARIPSVIASIGWVLVLYAFVRRVASRGAAWLTIGLFISTPTFIQITQMCRFYSLHGFTFLLAAVLVFAAMQTRSNVGRVGLSLASAVLLAVSWHLQATTLIGLAGLLAWLVAISLPGALVFLRQRRANAIVAGLVGALAITAAFFLVPWSHFIDLALETPYWAEGRAGNYLFYARSLLADLHFAWLLLPAFAVAGFRRLPRVVWFACVIFATAFILHTVAASKADRYIAYALPFVCLIAGIALAELIGAFRQTAIDVWRGIAGSVVPEKVGGVAIVTACVVFAVLMNPNTSNAVLGVVDAEASGLAQRYAIEPDWREARETLLGETEGSPVLVASSGTKALFYLGYYDYELNVSVVYETDTDEEFGVDDRTGGLVIGELESLKQVVACSPQGLVVADGTKWRVRSHVAPAVAEYIEQTMQPVTVPESANLRVYTWTSAPNRSMACDRLPRSRSTMTS